MSNTGCKHPLLVFFTTLKSVLIYYYYPFSTKAPFIYPLKTSENLQFSDVFRRHRSRTLTENGLMVTSNSIACNSILIFLHSCSNLEDYRYCKNTEKFIYSFSLRFPPKKVKTYRVEVILSEIWGLHLL